MHPYAIEEIRTLATGELVYNHERDEPPRKQIFDEKVVGELNTMLQAVVLEGTGKAAQLDYTYSVGKTGTSSAYRDAWFIGFTGQYVTGVWLGNDDFTPMARVTGGSFPAQTWHNYMMAAHDTDNIPQIVGLPVHPVQAAEQANIAAATAQNAHSQSRDRRRARARKREGHGAGDASGAGEAKRHAQGRSAAEPERCAPGSCRGARGRHRAETEPDLCQHRGRLGGARHAQSQAEPQAALSAGSDAAAATPH